MGKDNIPETDINHNFNNIGGLCCLEIYKLFRRKGVIDSSKYKLSAKNLEVVQFRYPDREAREFI